MCSFGMLRVDFLASRLQLPIRICWGEKNCLLMLGRRDPRRRRWRRGRLVVVDLRGWNAAKVGAMDGVVGDAYEWVTAWWAGRNEEM